MSFNVYESFEAALRCVVDLFERARRCACSKRFVAKCVCMRAVVMKRFSAMCLIYIAVFSQGTLGF